MWTFFHSQSAINYTGKLKRITAIRNLIYNRTSLDLVVKYKLGTVTETL